MVISLSNGEDTVPSFRIALAMEKERELKPFRNILNKPDRKKFLMIRRCFDISELCFTALAGFFSKLSLTVRD